MQQIRLKYLTKEPLKYGLNIEARFYKNEGIRFLRTTDLNDEGEIIGKGIYLDKEMVPDEYLLKKGDILFSRSGSIGRAYFHQIDEPITYAGFLVRFRLEDVELAKWIYYFSKTPSFKRILFSEAIESTIQNFNGQKYNNIAVPINNLSLTINNYLDNKTAKIQKFIKNKTRFIELLKEKRQAVIDTIINGQLLMVHGKLEKPRETKPSGIDWLGDIPEHWEVRRLKNIVQYKKGVVPLSFSDESSFYPYLSMDYLRGKKENLKYVQKAGKSLLINENEVLILWDGANAGEVILSKKGYLSSTMAILHPNKDYFLKPYFYYFLKAKENYFKDKADGTTIPHLDQDSIFNTNFKIPPLPQQKAIAQYLNNKTAKIDQSIAKTEKEIALIKEYKEAMISEAVVGKLNIND